MDSAVRHASDSPVAVVTGPPGTGKSQTIVSIVASVLFSGGNVLGASKNHQALDAVESRLNDISSDVPFSVRTLDPSSERDNSFESLLNVLVREPLQSGKTFDAALQFELQSLADSRNTAMDIISKRAQLNCEVARLLDRIENREKYNTDDATASNVELTEKTRRVGIFFRIMNGFFGTFFRRKSNDEEASLEELSKPHGAPIEILQAGLEEARANLENLETPKNPVELTEQIAELAAKLLPGLVSKRTMLSEDARLRLAETMDNLKISGKSVPSDSSAIKRLLSCRPLWLALIL